MSDSDAYFDEEGPVTLSDLSFLLSHLRSAHSSFDFIDIEGTLVRASAIDHIGEGFVSLRSGEVVDTHERSAKDVLGLMESLDSDREEYVFAELPGAYQNA